MATKEILDAVIAKANAADEATLISMLEAQPPSHKDFSMAPGDWAELERRRLRYERGESKGHSWEEVLQHVAERRSNGKLLDYFYG